MSTDERLAGGSVPPDAPGARELAAQLGALGVDEGGVLVVHTSYRALRPVRGGPDAVIDALRLAVGAGGTIVMPSWGDDDDAPFDAASTPVATDLGIVAGCFRLVPGVVRSNHPFAFAAQGPRAAEIVADPLPLPPHRLESPVGRVYELDGQVLLLGVGHDADTTVHLAEVLASVPYGTAKHCTISEHGATRRIDYSENDHCCARFARVSERLRDQGLEFIGRVGSAEARLVRSRDVVAAASELLRDDPLAFLHPPGECDECDGAHASIGRGGDAHRA